MGFFSKLCAVSHLPVMAELADFPQLSNVVAFLEDGTILKGCYDGYGRINGVDLNVAGDYEAAKFVLKQHYKPGMNYLTLPPSGRDPGQGYFHDHALLYGWMTAGGFKSDAEMEKAYWGEVTA